MIKLIDILREVAEGLIGPFYHETTKENVESILKNGLQPARISNTPDSTSLSPAAPSGMYGEAVIEVYLDQAQFKRAVAFTYNMIKADEDLLEKRDIELAEKLINRTITNEEYKELINRALHNEGFLSGEILVGEPISASQIKTELSEQSKGLWYYINRKKKLGIKSSPKNSKKYKAAVKAGKELSNEEISEEIKYNNPNLENEWEEAVRYPELGNLGKEGWIELAKKGSITNYSSIKDKLGNVDLEFDSLEQDKKERFNNAFKKGVIELPIAVKFNDNDYDLVAGNTRLSGLVKNQIDPKIWIVDISDINEGVHDPVKPGILKNRLGKLSCTRVRAAKAKLKDKGTHYAKALQRYLNYHCND